MNSEILSSQELSPGEEHNFNDSVYVKVTPEGEKLLKDYYDKFRTDATVPYTIERDAEGYTRMQMHEVIQVFGESFYNGNTKMPIEMTFRTKAPGIDEPSAEMNFNNIVDVKVTPEGEKLLKDYYDKFRTDATVPYTIERDAEGYTRMQMHEIMQVFGKSFYIGNAKMPIEMTYKVQPNKK